MALNDSAVIVAAQGFVYQAPVGTARPTPSDIAAFDEASFGSQVQEIKLTSGTASGGTYTVKFDVSDTPAVVAWNASAAVLQTAIEGLESVGSGNVEVSGTALSSGYLVKFVNALQGETHTGLLLDDASLTGSTPVLPNNATISTAFNGWDQVGHTSREDMPEWGFDGGDVETRGTWQKKRLREIATGDPVADSVVLNVQQWDADALELYYGENASATPGVFGVDGNFVPLERALLVVIVDGGANLGFYAAKASIRRDDAISLPVDDFASLPIRATFLNYGTSNLYDWINEDLF